MAGIGQRSTFEHPSSWNNAAQLGMGRNVRSDVQKNSSFQSNSDKRSLLSNAIGTSTLGGLNSNLNLNYTPRPSSSTRLKTQNSIGSSMRNNYNQEPGVDNMSFNFHNYGSGSNFPGTPSRGLSEPSLFMNHAANSDLSSLMSNLTLNTKSPFMVTNKSSNTTLGLLSGSANNSSNLITPGVTSPGLTFDPSDFPPIVNSANQSQSQNFSAPSQNRNYVSVISKNPNVVSTPVGSSGGGSQGSYPNSNIQSPPEFSIERDFPALPVVQTVNTPSTTGTVSASSSAASGPPASSSSQSLCAAAGEALLKLSHVGQRAQRSHSSSMPSGGGNNPSVSNPNASLQFLHENLVANIPPNMIDSQFGMIGLLKLIQIEPYFDMLAPGIKLPALGLSNCSPPGELHKVFGSPLNDSCVVSPHDLDFAVPAEYRTRLRTAGKLIVDPPLESLSEEILFYVFYNFCKEEVQLVVAKELYERDWRFHKKRLRWLTRVQGTEVVREGVTEQGTYIFYEPLESTKVVAQATVNYTDLDETPASYQLSSPTLNAKVHYIPQGCQQQTHVLGNPSAQGYFGQPNARSSRTQLPAPKMMPNGALMQQQHQQQMAVTKPEIKVIDSTVNPSLPNKSTTSGEVNPTTSASVPTSTTISSSSST